MGTAVIGAVTMFNPGRPYGIVGPGVHIDSWSPLCSQPWTSCLWPMEATPHQTQKARGTVHGGHKDQPLGHGNGAEGAAWGFPRSPWHAASSRFLSSGTFLISLLSRMHARTQACTLTHAHTHSRTAVSAEPLNVRTSRPDGRKCHVGKCVLSVLAA